MISPYKSGNFQLSIVNLIGGEESISKDRGYKKDGLPSGDMVAGGSAGVAALGLVRPVRRGGVQTRADQVQAVRNGGKEKHMKREGLWEKEGCFTRRW